MFRVSMINMRRWFHTIRRRQHIQSAHIAQISETKRVTAIVSVLEIRTHTKFEAFFALILFYFFVRHQSLIFYHSGYCVWATVYATTNALK